MARAEEGEVADGAPDISVVVPAHRAAALLPACLDALAAQTLDRDRFEVLVVDTGADGAEPLVETAGCRYLLDRRRGPAAKRNAGAGAALGRHLAFTDPDCLPEPGWLEAGLRELEAGAEVVQGRVLPPEGRPTSDFGHRLTVAGPSPLYESCNIFYARPLFERLGGFPEHLHAELGEHFGEDTLLGVRARRAGARIAFREDALVRHEAFAPDLRRHLAERWRLRHFPYLVGQAPELREALTAGVFLTPASPLTWLLAAALLGRRPLLAVPYALRLARRLPWEEPPRALRNAPLYILSDLVGAAALLYGTLRHRHLVL